MPEGGDLKLRKCSKQARPVNNWKYPNSEAREEEERDEIARQTNSASGVRVMTRC